MIHCPLGRSVSGIQISQWRTSVVFRMKDNKKDKDKDKDKDKAAEGCLSLASLAALSILTLYRHDHHQGTMS